MIISSRCAQNQQCATTIEQLNNIFQHDGQMQPDMYNKCILRLTIIRAIINITCIEIKCINITLE